MTTPNFLLFKKTNLLFQILFFRLKYPIFISKNKQKFHKRNVLFQILFFTLKYPIFISRSLDYLTKKISLRERGRLDNGSGESKELICLCEEPFFISFLTL